jgi:hypothetical protein
MPDGRDVAGHVDRPAAKRHYCISGRLNQTVKVVGVGRVMTVNFRPLLPTMFVAKVEFGLHRSR